MSTENATEAQVTAALKAGYRAFECSPTYGNQESVGRALATFSGSREDLFIASKVPITTPQSLQTTLTTTLSHLSCSYLDLLLLDPTSSPNPTDPSSPGEVKSPTPGDAQSPSDAALSSTWPALEASVASGSARALGTCHVGLAAIEQLVESAAVKPSCCVLELHPLCAQRKIVGVLLRKGVQAVAWGPTGGGSTELLQHSAVAQVAQACEHSEEEALLKWSAQRGTPVLVPAAAAARVEPEHFFSWRMLEERDKVVLDRLDEGRRLAGSAGGDVAKASCGILQNPSEVLQYGS